MNEELKTCPFCGAPADISPVYGEDGKYKWFYTVFCTNVIGCGAAVDSDTYYDENEAKADAIKRWNRRIKSGGGFEDENGIRT